MYIGAPNTEPSRIVPAINWYCLLRWTFMSAATRLQLQLHFFTVNAAKVERVWFFSFCPQFFFNDFHTSHQSQSKHSTKRFNKRKNGRHGWPNPMPKSHGWWTAPGTTSERWRHLFVDEGFAVAQAGHFKGEDLYERVLQSVSRLERAAVWRNLLQRNAPKKSPDTCVGSFLGKCDNWRHLGISNIFCCYEVFNIASLSSFHSGVPKVKQINLNLMKPLFACSIAGLTAACAWLPGKSCRLRARTPKLHKAPACSVSWSSRKRKHKSS